jgi:glutathione peroxidase
MNRHQIPRILASALLLVGALAFAKEATMSLYDLTVNTLAGKPQPLSLYKGKVSLVVNTASECGFTPQYAGLEKLFEQYQGKGMVILGFPSNDFGGQEPGTAEQIHAFCQKNYGVTFPMFEKVHTKGAEQAPVYKFVTAKSGEPKWNFTKYLVGKDGQVKKMFPSNVTPESKELHDAIDAALKE